MIYTTLNKIRAHGPCSDGWEKLLKHLGKTQADDEPLPLLTILDNNGLDDTLWCLRTIPEYDKHWRLFAVWCVKQVEHLMEDPRSLKALGVAARYARNETSDDELQAARVAARVAAWNAARAAAWNAARAAAWNAAGEAAWNAARAAQEEEFRRLLNEVTP